MKESRRLTTGIYKGRAEHKYDYSADQSKIPAFGWSSTTQHVGLYLINPSFEYLSSGPLHFELTGQIDDGDGGDPTLLDYAKRTFSASSVAIAFCLSSECKDGANPCTKQLSFCGRQVRIGRAFSP
jgi:rhamnogalacturonan endolyase